MIQGPTCHAEDTHVHPLCSDKERRTQAGEDSGLATDRICEGWALWDVILLIFKRCLCDERIESLSNCVSSKILPAKTVWQRCYIFALRLGVCMYVCVILIPVYVIYIFVCIHCIYVHMHMYACVSKAEVNIRLLLKSVSTLLFKAEFLIIPWSGWLD